MSNTINCPHCNKEVNAKATKCPHCHELILHKDPGKNAILTLISYVVTFWLIYQGLTWFIDRETDKTMARINRDAAQEVKRIEREIYLNNIR